MSTPRPDQTTFEKLIALGQCADGDARIGELLGALKPRIPQQVLI